jgi:hypothetical protein
VTPPGDVPATDGLEAERAPEASCPEAQADGVPCETVEGACAECERAVVAPSASESGRKEG